MTVPRTTAPHRKAAPAQLRLCAKGQHGLLIPGAPQQTRGCINVDYRCDICGRLVKTVSTARP